MTEPSTPDREQESRQRAVRGLRIFMPLYMLGVAPLACAPLTRIAGVEVPGLPIAATLCMISMAIAAPTFLAWLGRLGQYNTRTGLAFRLLPALLRGEYSALGQASAPQARSALGSTGEDARRAAADLDAAGLDGVAQTLRAVLSEAEIVHLGLDRLAARPDLTEAGAELIVQARGAQARVRDMVAGLHGPGPVNPDSLRADMEGLLLDLRRVSDQLRST